MRAAIPHVAFVLVCAMPGLAQEQIRDLAGEWRVGRPPAIGPSSDWLRALPGAVYTLTHSIVPPLGMIRKDLGYTYFPGSIRPDYTGASIYAAPAGLFLNPAAFKAPVA